MQGGPSFVSRDGAEELSIKLVARSVLKPNLTEDVTAYSEIKAYSGDDWDLGDVKHVSVKAGVKYTF